MSLNRPTVLWPGPARLTLVLLAVIPAAMAYPWPTPRDRWVLGVAVVVVIVLLGWWRGLHFTTMLRRRAAMLRGNRANGSVSEPAGRATAVLRIAPGDGGEDLLPLSVIAGYLDRYGIHADSIQITSRDDAGAKRRQTWIGVSLSAADNLAALQARSSSIPLQETAQVTARRLVDHLREAGWAAAVVPAESVPAPVRGAARETWRAVLDGDDYLAAYRITVDAALPDTLRQVWTQPADETWTTVQFAGTAAEPTVAAACVFRTGDRPHGASPLPGLTPQRGIHRAVLQAIDPACGNRLDGHTAVSPDAVRALRWPSGRRGRKPAAKGRHAVT